MRTSKIIVVFVFLAAFIMPAAGQNTSDSIHTEKRLGTVFTQNGKTLTPKQMLTITKSNPQAYKEMKTAKANSDAANVFGFIGGFLIGWPVGTALGGGAPNWTVAAVGGGFIGLSIPFTIGYKRHAKNAVKIYNRGLVTSETNKLKFHVGLTGRGVGIRMSF